MGAVAGATYTKDVILPTTGKVISKGYHKGKDGVGFGGHWVHDKIHGGYLKVIGKFKPVDTS